MERGGTLIGFGIEGLDHGFGIQTHSVLAQTDDYAIAGSMALQAHPLTEQIHSRLHPEQPLLILSDIQSIDLQGAEEVARLHNTAGDNTAQPAITWHRYGSGSAAYFAFDVAKTIWLLHQGRPVLQPRPDDRYRRTNQLQLIAEHSNQVGYADELLLLIQNMLAPTHQPFVHQIPRMAIACQMRCSTGVEIAGTATRRWPRRRTGFAARVCPTTSTSVSASLSGLAEQDVARPWERP